MTITESIKFNKLQEENELLKKELDEKDKEIKELKSEQLYKEDFEKEKVVIGFNIVTGLSSYMEKYVLK